MKSVRICVISGKKTYMVLFAEIHKKQNGIKNKTILITDGASGIGLEIVKLLAIENKVIIVGRKHIWQ